MRYILAGIGCIICTAVIAGCADSGVARESSGRVSLNEAIKMVRADVMAEKTGMNPGAEFSLKEMTTEEIWEKMHAQLFVMADGVQMDQAYVIHEGRVDALGISFGGDGVGSTCVVNGDGEAELVFGYSWGSGVHRGCVGMWRPGEKWREVGPALRDYDLFVEKTDEREVRVIYKMPARNEEAARVGTFGVLTLKDGKFEMVLADLPEDIAIRVWK